MKHELLDQRELKMSKGKVFFVLAESIRRMRGKHLKGPKHDQVGCEFFYIKQTRMVR